jgi:hypothetical protein
MKTQKLIIGLVGLVMLTVSGCDKSELNNDTEYRTNEVLYSRNSKLKRVFQCYPDNSSQAISEYEYDNLGRIHKIIYPTSDYSYKIYKYNTNGQLTNIFFYSTNSVVNIIFTYTYDTNGNKIKEEIENIDAGTSEYTLYFYENHRNTKSEHYTQGTLNFYILYEYNSSNQVEKEFFSIPNVPDDEPPIVTEHAYNEGLLIYSITYNGAKNLMWDSKKIYDMNDNLVKTIENFPGLSSIAGGNFYETRRYEYGK